MQTLNYFLLLIFCSVNLNGHDVQMAQFTFHFDHKKSTLSIVVDQDDLHKVIGNKSNSGRNEFDIVGEKKMNFIESYFNKQLHLHLNDQIIYMSIKKLSVIKDHYKVEFELSTINEVIHSLSFKNNSFIEVVRNHSNIVSFNYKGKRRDFHMNKNRTELLLSYE